MSLTTLFCQIDDFCKGLPAIPLQLTHGPKQRQRQSTLSVSEVMTLVVHFHQSSYRNFKAYYTQHVIKHLRRAFPELVSYNRFVELMPMTLLPLCLYLQRRKGRCTGISFIDSMPIQVCHNRRIHQHKVFDGVAQRGKNSMGWFFGFKLHLVINDRGELLAVQLTPGNVDDRKPVPDLVKGLFGKLFADKGYISQTLFETLYGDGLALITKLRKNMKQRLLPVFDKLMLRKRALIESVNDQLKNISQIEHSRHRSVVGFMVNLVAGLIAYTYQAKKPSLNLSRAEWAGLPALL
jgi:hypothetical protein